MSFFLFILYIICVFIRPQDWVTMVLGAPLINILGVSTCIVIFLESAGKPAGMRFAKTPHLMLMMWFSLTILMSHIVHMHFWNAKNTLIGFLPTFTLFFVILNVINTERRLKATVWLIVLIIFVLVFQGMYQARNGYGWAGQLITTQEEGIARINWIGIFNNPNDLSQLFVIATGFLLPFVFSKGNFFQCLIGSTIAAYLVYGLYLTNSRGGMVSLAAAVLFFFVRKTGRYLIGGILGVICAVPVFIFGPSRMSMMTSTEESAATRLDLWYEAFQMLKSSPVFGIGQGKFGDEFSLTAHNTYMLAVSELGFLGLFLWIALIYVSMKALVIVQTTNESLTKYALGIQCALVGFCTASFFSSRLYIILPYLLFAMAGASLWITQSSRGTQVFKLKGADFRNILIVSVIILAVIYLTIRLG